MYLRALVTRVAIKDRGCENRSFISLTKPSLSQTAFGAKHLGHRHNPPLWMAAKRTLGEGQKGLRTYN
jgi:hypothetical protein